MLLGHSATFYKSKPLTLAVGMQGTPSHYLGPCWEISFLLWGNGQVTGLVLGEILAFLCWETYKTNINDKWTLSVLKCAVWIIHCKLYI